MISAPKTGWFSAIFSLAKQDHDTITSNIKLEFNEQMGVGEQSYSKLVDAAITYLQGDISSASDLPQWHILHISLLLLLHKLLERANTGKLKQFLGEFAPIIDSELQMLL